MERKYDIQPDTITKHLNGKGYSVKKLSELSGINMTRLWRIKNGIREITFSELVKLEKPFEVDLYSEMKSNANGESL